MRMDLCAIFMFCYVSERRFTKYDGYTCKLKMTNANSHKIGVLELTYLRTVTYYNNYRYFPMESVL